MLTYLGFASYFRLQKILPVYRSKAEIISIHTNVMLKIAYVLRFEFPSSRLNEAFKGWNLFLFLISWSNLHIRYKPNIFYVVQRKRCNH